MIALVGYTNVGKSSLLNRLAHSVQGEGAFVADQPFATLDPTLRRVYLGPGRYARVADTVGFITELPEELLARSIGPSMATVRLAPVFGKVSRKFSDVRLLNTAGLLNCAKRMLWAVPDGLAASVNVNVDVPFAVMVTVAVAVVEPAVLVAVRV